MRTMVSLLLVTLVPVCSAPARGSDPPLAVSPGNTSQVALVEASCPTFSWGEVAGAKAYKLVIYRVDDEGAKAEEVLNQTFPGSVESWTPSIGRCLERGGHYAWSIGAVGGEGPVDWSAPALFEIAAPTPVELEQALEVVRSYLSRVGAAAAAAEPPRPSADSGPAGQRYRSNTPTTNDGGESQRSSLRALPPNVGTSIFAESKVGSFAGAAVAGELLLGHPGWAVFGTALTGTGVKGTAGDATVSWTGETGVWGSADAFAVGSIPVGVLGEGSHRHGGKAFGGQFYSYAAGGVGVAAYAKRDVDLALLVDSLDGDDGLIGSEPSEASSDIILVSNDAVAVRLDQDNDGEDADFEVSTQNGVIFNVDESGTVLLKPTDSPDACNADTAGSFYYDLSIGDFCICRGTGWKQLSGGADC